MAQPSVYNRLTSFSNYQAAHPSDPLPGTSVDGEFNAVKVTVDEVLTNLALIQRDDGALANDSVGRDQITAEVEVGFNAPEVWVTATDYDAFSDVVFHSSGFYRCLVAHTAGTFATDLAAGKWELIVDLSMLTIVAASQIANTPAGSISSVTVQEAIDELASEKAALSHTHPSSAISDSTGAGRNMLAAADVAAQQALLGLGDLAFLDSLPVTDISSNIKLSGIIEPAALADNTNDWSPTGLSTCSSIRASASVAIDLTGINALSDGSLLFFENVGSFNITLKASSASSSAANRFLMPRDVIVKPNMAVILKYDADATTPRWRLQRTASDFPRGHLSGLALSNDSGDLTNDIGVATGECRDALDTNDHRHTTALIKRLDADWAAGTNQGMRYTTAIANGTYHIFSIAKADGTTDIFADTIVDPTAHLPSGYVTYRRIGSILRAGGAIVAFTQDGDYFVRDTPAADVALNNPGTTAVLHTLSVPVGIKVFADLAYHAEMGTFATSTYFWIQDPVITNVAASVSNATFVSANTTNTRVSGVAQVRTDTSGRVRGRQDGSSAQVTLYINTRGWRDTRGRLD